MIKSDYKAALKSFVGKVKFDVVFLDPPYKLNLISGILEFIYSNDLLNDDGIIVCEFEDENLNFTNYELYKSREYGSKKVCIYRKF